MKLFNKEKLRLNVFQTFAAAVIFSLYSVIFQSFLQNGLNGTGYLTYLINPLVFFMNFIPVFSLMLIFLSITGSLRTGFLCVNIPLTVFLLINEFKILFRDEPFKPTDLTLITETRGMLETYVLEFSPKIVICVVAMILVCLFVCFKVRNKRLPLIHRVLSFAVAGVMVFVSYVFVYSDYNKYDNTYMLGNQYHESEVFAEKGFIFSFISSFSGIVYEKPEGYSKEKAEEILSRFRVEENEKLPNVIMVMSESFFDMQPAEKLEFLPGRNPYEKLNSLKKEGSYGNLFVPGFAGGTASTEFETVSGSNITLIDSSMPTIYKTHIKKGTYSLPYAFRELGYKTTASHPWHPWFYNRQNVYKTMGFDSFFSVNDLPAGYEMKNYYPTDKLGAEMIIEDYKKHLKADPEQGYFHLHVSMQNHGPYSKTPVDEPRLVRPDGLTDEEYNILENYTANIYDATEMLLELKAYADSVSVPTVIVFYGDHLPQWDTEYKGYQSIDYEISGDDTSSIIRQHTTPWIIIGNDAFKKENPDSETGDRGLISSNFLCAELLRFINVDLSPFFSFVKELSDEVQVICSGFKICNGKISDDFPEALTKKIDEYKILQYYNLREYNTPAR